MGKKEIMSENMKNINYQVDFNANAPVEEQNKKLFEELSRAGRSIEQYLENEPQLTIRHHTLQLAWKRIDAILIKSIENDIKDKKVDLQSVSKENELKIIADGYDENGNPQVKITDDGKYFASRNLEEVAYGVRAIEYSDDGKYVYGTVMKDITLQKDIFEKEFIKASKEHDELYLAHNGGAPREKSATEQAVLFELKSRSVVLDSKEYKELFKEYGDKIQEQKQKLDGSFAFDAKQWSQAFQNDILLERMARALGKIEKQDTKDRLNTIIHEAMGSSAGEFARTRGGLPLVVESIERGYWGDPGKDLANERLRAIKYRTGDMFERDLKQITEVMQSNRDRAFGEYPAENTTKDNYMYEVSEAIKKELKQIHYMEQSKYISNPDYLKAREEILKTADLESLKQSVLYSNTNKEYFPGVKDGFARMELRTIATLRYTELQPKEINESEISKKQEIER